MRIERRRAPRAEVNGLATIKYGTEGVGQDCWISDVSDGGVRLSAEKLDVPDQFDLVFPPFGRARTCRIVWRLGHEIGAEFTDE